MAAPTINMEDDYLVWDNPEEIYYQTARASDPYTAPGQANLEERIDLAKWRALTAREQAASAGVYTANDRVCLIPQARMRPGLSPKPADVAIDGHGDRWTVLETQFGKWRQTWRLVCRNLALAYELDDVIDIQRATLSFDAAGIAVKAFPPDGGKTLYSKLLCRVQRRTEEVVEERGIRGEQTAYDVIVSRQVELNPAEDRILWRDQVLDVLSVQNPELITELPLIRCLLKT